MSDIRAVGSGLKDAEDDYAFQLLVTDVQRLKQELRKGSMSGDGGTGVGGPGGSGPVTNIINNTTATIAFSALSDFNDVGTGATAVTLQTFGTPDFDTNNAFASNTYTIPETGYYLIAANVTVQSNGGNIIRAASYLKKNGSTLRTVVAVNGEIASSNANLYVCVVNELLLLSAGDYLNLYSAILEVISGSSHNYFTAFYWNIAKI